MKFREIEALKDLLAELAEEGENHFPFLEHEELVQRTHNWILTLERKLESENGECIECLGHGLDEWGMTCARCLGTRREPVYVDAAPRVKDD